MRNLKTSFTMQVHCACPRGGGELYTNHFRCDFLMPKEGENPDFISIQEWVQANMEAESMDIEGAVNTMATYLESLGCEQIVVRSSVDDASLHMPVTVTYDATQVNEDEG